MLLCIILVLYCTTFTDKAGELWYRAIMMSGDSNALEFYRLISFRTTNKHHVSYLQNTILLAPTKRLAQRM